MFHLIIPFVAPNPGLAFDLNSLISGGSGAALVGVVAFIIKLIADRTIPSRSDARASVSLVLDNLNGIIKTLNEEKVADAGRLSAKQKRIEVLESEAETDFTRIAELRAEVADLSARLVVKERHIQQLISSLKGFGAEVTGLDVDDIKITVHTGPVTTV